MKDFICARRQMTTAFSISLCTVLLPRRICAGHIPGYRGYWVVKRGDSSMILNDATYMQVESPSTLVYKREGSSSRKLIGFLALSRQTALPTTSTTRYHTTLFNIHWLWHRLGHSPCRRPRPPAPPPLPRPPHFLRNPRPINFRIM